MAKSKNTPFTLKSGNTPLFKHVGSSPYHKDDDTDTNTKKKDDKDDSKYTRDVTVEGGDIGKGWQVGISALTGGLDAVYGTGKIRFNRPKITKDPEETVNTIAENIIASDKKSKKEGPGSYVKEGGTATGEMKDYPLLSAERKKEYEARGWKFDDTIEGYNKDGSKK